MFTLNNIIIAMYYNGRKWGNFKSCMSRAWVGVLRFRLVGDVSPAAQEPYPGFMILRINPQ